ncbi:MAG: GDSL-type esterase/lipase family protein [Myxococcota bacterium]|nr:GDSL-type esterase/lipase family protein [Myxococcota bacterium]
MIPPKKIAFAFIPALTLFAFAECGARAVDAENCRAIEPDAGDWETMQGDRELLWSLVPNTEFKTGDDITRINAIGLREHLLPTVRKKPREKRVIVTGDSSIYGWGLRDNETYAVVLERELRSRFNVPIEVINFGVPGYSTEQSIRLLNKLGWDYEPDLLIVSNIFSDCNIDAFQDETAFALIDPKDGPFSKVLKSSRAYCALYMPWVNYQANLNQQPNRVLMPGIPTGPNAAVTLENLNASLALSRVPLAKYLENLSTLKTLAQNHSAQLMLAPLAQEWDVGIWNVPMPPPDDDHVLPWEPYRRAQKEWASNNNIDVISFPEVFAASPVRKNELFLDNMHPSQKGAIVMAKAVAKHLHEHPERLGLTNANRRGSGNPK